MMRAVVLLSGGLDSATTLYFARSKGYQCFCLVFDYGQRHLREIESAKKIAKKANCLFRVVKISFPWKGSSLLDKKIKLPVLRLRSGLALSKVEMPVTRYPPAAGIPSTYVPGRNIIFLGFAISYAEAISAQTIFIGANAIDYSGYPDCRPEFYRAFIKSARLGTKVGVEGRAIKIALPLIHKTKAQIIRLGLKLVVPYELTWSCYYGGRRPCGRCDSCYLRAKGFKEAGLSDPIFRLLKRAGHLINHRKASLRK